MPVNLLAVQSRSAAGAAARVTLALLTLWGQAAAAAKRNPCEGDTARVAPRTRVASPVGTPAAADSPGGYLIIKVENELLLGKPVYIGDAKMATLPAALGMCVWLPLPIGTPKVRTAESTSSVSYTVDITPRRTYLLTLRDGITPGVGGLLPRFALRVQTAGKQFPPDLRSGLLELAARAMPAALELSDEYSSSEPMDASGVTALLKQQQSGCDPKEFTSSPLQYVLVLQVDSPTGFLPEAQFAIRVYHTAVGESAPAAIIDDTSNRAPACSQPDAPERLLCMIRAALDLAKTRDYSCLRVTSGSAGTVVRLRPLAKEGPVGDFSLLGTTPASGTLDRGMFIGQEATYELTWTHPGSFMVADRNGRRATLLPNEVVSFTAQLARPALPLYKQWWLWQLVGTAVAIGIGGAVGAVYANSGGTP